MAVVGYTEFTGIDYEYRLSIVGNGNGTYLFTLEGKTTVLISDDLNVHLTVYSGWPDSLGSLGYATLPTAINTWTTMYTCTLDCTSFMYTPQTSDISITNTSFEETTGNAYSTLRFSSDWIAPPVHELVISYVGISTDTRRSKNYTFDIVLPTHRYYKQGTVITLSDLAETIPTFTYSHTKIEGTTLTTLTVNKGYSVYIYYTASYYFFNTKIIDLGTIDLTSSKGLLDEKKNINRKLIYGDLDLDFQWPCTKNTVKIFKFTLPSYSASGFTGNYVFVPNKENYVFLHLSSNNTTYSSHCLLCTEELLANFNWTTGYAPESISSEIIAPGTYYAVGAYSTYERGSADFNYTLSIDVAWERADTSKWALIEDEWLDDSLLIECASTGTRLSRIYGRCVVYRKVRLNSKCYINSYGGTSASNKNFITLGIPLINEDTGAVLNKLTPPSGRTYLDYLNTGARDIYIGYISEESLTKNYFKIARFSTSSPYATIYHTAPMQNTTNSLNTSDTIPTHTLTLKAVIDDVVYDNTNYGYTNLTGVATYFADKGYRTTYTPALRLFKEGFKVTVLAAVKATSGRKEFYGWYDSYPITEHSVCYSENRMFTMNMPTSDLTLYCIYYTIDLPFDWERNNPKVSGGEFNLTANEWNELKEYSYSNILYLTSYVYENYYVSGSEDYGLLINKLPTAYNQVATGDIFTASECNDVISILNSGKAASDPAISSVNKADIILASLLNLMKTYANKQNGFTT